MCIRDRKNRFSFKKIFTKGVNTREALVEYMESLHTAYAEEVGLKYGMERGDSKMCIRDRPICGATAVLGIGV